MTVFNYHHENDDASGISVASGDTLSSYQYSGTGNHWDSPKKNLNVCNSRNKATGKNAKNANIKYTQAFERPMSSYQRREVQLANNIKMSKEKVSRKFLQFTRGEIRFPHGNVSTQRNSNLENTYANSVRNLTLPSHVSIKNKENGVLLAVENIHDIERKNKEELLIQKTMKKAEHYKEYVRVKSYLEKLKEKNMKKDSEVNIEPYADMDYHDFDYNGIDDDDDDMNILQIRTKEKEPVKGVTKPVQLIEAKKVETFKKKTWTPGKLRRFGPQDLPHHRTQFQSRVIGLMK